MAVKLMKGEVKNIKYPAGYQERVYDYLTQEQIRVLLNPESPKSPFYGYVGNRPAVETYCDVLYSGFLSPSLVQPQEKSNRSVGPKSLSFIGPPSTGKTELAKRGGQVLEIPFMECDRSVRGTEDLLEVMRANYRKWGVKMVTDGGMGAAGRMLAPPAIIFFDEAQELRGDWLLKATEPKDATLITKNAIVDVRQILWIFCTTHRGKLSSALDSRMVKIMLKPYTRQEVTEILMFRFKDKFSKEIAFKIAGYGRCIPRECISFAEQVLLHADRVGTKKYDEVCKYIADRNGVDEDGLTSQHIEVLTTLFKVGDRGMSHKRLADQCHVAEEDLTNFILPPISIQQPDRDPLITVSSKGYNITEAGKTALRDRKLPLITSG